MALCAALVAGVAQARSLAAPSGPPTLGPDADGDRVPAHARVPMSRGADVVVPLDPDDRAPATPVPFVEIGCSPPDEYCVVVGNERTRYVVGGSPLPRYECQTGRLTLCWYWHPYAFVGVDHETGQDREARAGPFVVLP